MSVFNSGLLGTIFKIIFLVFLICLILFIIILIINYIRKVRKNEPVLLSGVINSRGGMSFPGSDIPKSSIGTEYTYSFWIYPSGWDYKFGQPKHVLSRGSNPREGNKVMVFNPGVWFYPKTSNLMIRFDTYGNNGNLVKKPGLFLEDIPGEEVSPNEFQDMTLEMCKEKCLNSTNCKGITYNKQDHECSVKNNIDIYEEESNFDSYVKSQSMNPYQYDAEDFDPSDDCDLLELPLQRWSHVVISLWNRTTDIYLNGKLVRSCVLKNVPKIPHEDPLYICQDGGYDGYFSQLRYFNRALNADEIYKLYSKGAVGWNLFSPFGNAYSKLTSSGAKKKSKGKKAKK
jgi:hypothetical protein